MTAIRAAIFETAHEPLAIESIDVDQPMANEVLVRVVASGVCHSDLHYVDGDRQMAATGPGSKAVLGHEGAGIVEAVGEGVTYVQPGDHVISCLSAFCGACDQCLTGHPARCRNRGGRPEGAMPRLSKDGIGIAQFVGLGTYAEKMLVGENALVKIDDEMPLEQAALLGCGVLTGVGAALNTAKVAPGSTVAVYGCGGVGLSILQGARLAGAKQIIAIDRFASKEAMARDAGATHFVASADNDPVAAVKSLTGGLGVDYSFEAVGRPELVRLAVESLGVGGTATVVGVMPTDAMLEIPHAALGGEKKLQTCSMGSNRFRIDIPRYIELYRQGRLHLDEMVSVTRPLDEINDAFRAMKAGEVARTVLTLN